MKQKNILLFALFLTAFWLPLTALAKDEKGKTEPAEAAKEEEKKDEVKFFDYQLVCESDIFYSWTHLPPVEKEDINSKAAKPNEKQEEKKEEVAKPISVFYSKVGAHGHIEVDVKRELAAKLQKVKRESLDFCARKHQNQTSCISNGFNSIRSDYQEADYQVRKALLDSVIKSCESGYGVCSGAESSEITCYENRPPELKPKQ